jgi:hypothetical protein
MSGTRGGGDSLEFIYTDESIDSAEGLLDAEQLRALENELLEAPEAGSLIVGTGGVRKMRFAARGKGKSGGVRVLYVYAKREQRIYFLLTYPKNVRDSLDQGEKNGLKKWVRQRQ